MLLEYFMSEQKPGWGSQFRKAIMLGPQIEENMIIDEVTLSEAVGHFLTMTWKILFACVPPTHWGGGWPAFMIALSFIGGVTAVVGDVAALLGCVVGMPNSVTAITLVALGTSLPDTFASITAARSSEYADSAVGNVTGSNSVNVFLGLGLPWVIAATYQSNRDAKYITPAGNLAYSVTVFVICSVICFIVLGVRRKVSLNLVILIVIILCINIGYWRRARWTKILSLCISSIPHFIVDYLHYFVNHQGY
jgi:solute carrier family 8 (sodium/calcium exchanger)